MKSMKRVILWKSKKLRQLKLRKYCGDVLCPDCIFNFRGDCILSESNHNYIPNDWLIDLIRESSFMSLMELNKGANRQRTVNQEDASI